MKTRTKLLDQMISDLQAKRHRLYLDWINDETDLSFHESIEYTEWLNLLEQITELEKEYD